MSIHGYRIINYPNLELDKFACVLVSSYKARQEAVSRPQEPRFQRCGKIIIILFYIDFDLSIRFRVH